MQANQHLDAAQATDGVVEVERLIETLQNPSPSAPQFHQAFNAVPVEQEDAALAELVGIYSNLARLLPNLRDWIGQGQFDAAAELAQVVARMPEVGACEALSYFEIVATMPEHYRHTCALYLAEQLVPTVVAACCQALTVQIPFNERQAEAWAMASTCTDPVCAIHTPDQFSGPNQTQLKLMILELVRVDQEPVRAAILEQEGDIVAFLLARSSVPALSQRAWTILARIASFSAPAGTAVSEAIEHRNIDAIHGRANSLLNVDAVSHLAGEEFQETVRVLMQFALEDAGLLAKLDRIIFLRMRSQSGTQDGLAGLTICAAGGVNPVKRMRLSIEHVRSKPSLHGQLLTSWLLDSIIPHSVVRSALHDCPIGQAPSLDIASLIRAGEQGQRNVVRRLLGLFHDGSSLCAMAATFAEASQLQPLGIELAQEMFGRTWSEYSSEVEEFVETRLKKTQRKSPAGNLYAEIKANAERWKTVLAQLPSAKELTVSAEKRRVLRAIEQRHARDIFRKAESQSIFSSLAHKAYAAQGTRIVVEMADGSLSVMKLQNHSQSISLPTSELCDPLGGRISRQKILREVE